MRNLVTLLAVLALTTLAGCSHARRNWIVDIEECDPSPSPIKLCHKVLEWK